MMNLKTIEVCDWTNEFGPAVLDNLNKILVAKGIEPLKELHGGWFKDGKWVNITLHESSEYRNYWHIYADMWGEGIMNGHYQNVYFPNPNNDEEWDFLARYACGYRPNNDANVVYQNWPADLVHAVRMTLKEHFTCEEIGGNGNFDKDTYRLVFEWDW